VSDLATSSHDKRYPYESTGLKEAVDPIQLDGIEQYKGTLHYTARFIPALALEGVRFESRPNELQRVAESTDSSEDGGEAIDATTAVSTPPIPDGITAWHPYGGEAVEKSQEKNATSTDAVSTHSAQTTTTVESGGSGPKLVEMSREELLQQQSGIIVINVRSGQLAKKARVEVLLDDGYWPAIATIKSRSTNACWDHVGEGFVKELDFGQLSLRLDESSNDDKDNIIAEWKGETKAFLQATLVCACVIWRCLVSLII